MILGEEFSFVVKKITQSLFVISCKLSIFMIIRRIIVESKNYRFVTSHNKECLRLLEFRSDQYVSMC